MTSIDPLAGERFRTIVGETIENAQRAGWPSDDIVNELVPMIVDEFPQAHFEYRVNEAGVRVRKVVVESREEIDPAATVYRSE